jgi:C4-dicarboxylate transporter, DctM subunit
MTPETIGLIGIVVLMVFFAFRMWVGAALAITGFVGLIFLQGWDRSVLVIGNAPYIFISKESFTVMPMFMLMGNVIAETGIASDLYSAAHKWIGQFRGGLAMATTFAAALFSAIVGTTSAGVLVFGKVAYPEMKKFNYSDDLSTGTIVASSTMGILIPPSMGFIIYGILTEVSVGKLFMAGIIPGLVQMIMYLMVIFIICRINPLKGPAGPKTTWKEKAGSVKNIWMMAALFLIVMGSIYTGVCTPTEAGAIGAFGAIAITFFSRRLTLKKFKVALLDSALLVSMLLLVLMCAAIFTKFMALSELPFWLGQTISNLHLSPVLVMIFIMVVYIVAGTALPGMLLIILTVPIVYPVALALGFDPIWFGVMMVIMVEIGDISPPEGMIVFLMSGMTGVKITTIFRGLFPFLAGDLIRIGLLMAIPQMALFLPSHM